jgi:hypothetical protein
MKRLLTIALTILCIGIIAFAATFPAVELTSETVRHRSKLHHYLKNPEFPGDVYFDSTYDLWWDSSESTLEALDNTTIAVGTGDDWTVVHNGTTTTIAGAATITGAQTINGTVSSNATYCTFDNVGIAATKTSGGGAATGTGGDENLLLMPEGMFEYHILGTQTILQPALVTGGLDIGMDQVDNDGVELSQGITAQAKHAYTVGTDAAFYFKATLDVADVTGSDDLLIGFRKAEAYQADPDDYDEMAAFNIQQGQIEIHTILNNGGTAETDTTETDWVDGASHSFTVKVSAAGVVTFEYDDAAPTATKVFSFDDTEVVVPFIMCIQHGDLTEVAMVELWECGLQ